MPPSSCAFSVSPATGEIGGTAHTGGVQVTTLDACEWSATSAASWLHVSSTGHGPGPLAFTVDANPTSSPRSGTITIGNAFNTVTYTLTQRAGTSNDAAADQVLYYHTDAIGSVRLITNSSGGRQRLFTKERCPGWL